MVRGVAINVDEIIDLMPMKLAITINSENPEHHKIAAKKWKNILFIEVNSETLFQEIKFKYIQYIKKHPDPKSRVAYFEVKNEHGFIDFKKYDRLIEMRKTRKEKQKEMDDEIALMQEMKVYKLEYNGPLTKYLGGKNEQDF